MQDPINPIRFLFYRIYHMWYICCTSVQQIKYITPRTSKHSITHLHPSSSSFNPLIFLGNKDKCVWEVGETGLLFFFGLDISDRREVCRASTLPAINHKRASSALQCWTYTSITKSVSVFPTKRIKAFEHHKISNSWLPGTPSYSWIHVLLVFL